MTVCRKLDCEASATLLVRTPFGDPALCDEHLAELGPLTTDERWTDETVTVAIEGGNPIPAWLLDCMRTGPMRDTLEA